MWLQNLQVLKLDKLSYSIYGPNLEQNLLTNSFKNLENAVAETVIIKCYHTTRFTEINYLTYTI